MILYLLLDLTQFEQTKIGFAKLPTANQVLIGLALGVDARPPAPLNLVIFFDELSFLIMICLVLDLGGYN